MLNVDARAIAADVATRIAANQNGFVLRVDPEMTYPSIETVYVFVRVVGGGGPADELNRIFHVVERESSDRFHVDVCGLPAPPELEH